MPHTDLGTIEKRLSALEFNILMENLTSDHTGSVSPIRVKLKEQGEKVLSTFEAWRERMVARLEDLESLTSNHSDEILTMKQSQTFIKEELDTTNSSLLAINHMRDRINETLDKVIPIGFIYTQLPFQKSPEIIWPWALWEQITSNYSGHFFRAEGGRSNEFGVPQDDAIRDHRHDFGARFSNKFTSDHHRVKLHSKEPFYLDEHGLSGYISRYDLSGKYISYETRPKNYAVRIWIRISGV